MTETKRAELMLHNLNAGTKERKKLNTRALVLCILAVIGLGLIALAGEPQHLQDCPPGSADVCRVEDERR